MYRSRTYIQVHLGHAAQYLAIAAKLNELRRTRGWTEFTLWVHVVGRVNEVVVEGEFPDLASFQQQGEAFRSDPEAMALLRSTVEHVVDGSVRSELLMPAPELA